MERSILVLLLVLAVTATLSGQGWIAVIDGCNKALGVVTINGKLVATCACNSSTTVLIFDADGGVSKALEVTSLTPRMATIVNDTLVVVGSVNGSAAVAKLNLSNETCIGYIFENGLSELHAIDEKGGVAASSNTVILLNSLTAYNLTVDNIYAVDEANGLLLIGGSVDGDAIVLLMNATSGEVLWSVKIATSYPDWVSAASLVDGIAYIAGVVDYPPNIFVAALNASNGEVVWLNTVGTPASDIATGLKVLTEYVVVTGYTNGVTEDGSYALLLLYFNRGSGALANALALVASSYSIIMPRAITFSMSGAASLPGVLWLGNIEKALIAYIPSGLTTFDNSFEVRSVKLLAMQKPQIEPYNVTSSLVQLTVTQVQLDVVPATVTVNKYAPATTTTPPPPPSPLRLVLVLVAAVAAIAAIYAVCRFRLKPRETTFVKRRGFVEAIGA